jgi:chemotaxis protein MotB
MTYGLKRGALLFPLLAPIVLSACGASESKYDALSAQNQQLQQQIAADRAHISRLQGAIKYTVNSDLLFPSGSWQMSDDGKEIIAKMAKTLAAGQQDKLIVNGYTDNAAIGPKLKREGITSNQMLSQKRAETVMEYMISEGVKPNLVAAKGFGEAQPVASNATARGRAQNRRVEVTLAAAGS